MMLKDLLKEIAEKKIYGNSNIEITDITSDSRKVKDGSLFVAIKGTNENGHNYIHDAIKKGARALVVENFETISADYSLPIVIVPNSRHALGKLASALNGFPSEFMRLAAVTGTNGKTTITYLMESMIKSANYQSGVIGTISYRYKDKDIPATTTTPGADEIQKLLKKMLNEGITHVVMEVSSHALHQDRVLGCHFDVAIFTNLTAEHLDYHKDEEEYFKSKAKLFLNYMNGNKKKKKLAIINCDDPKGREILEMIKVDALKYGLNFKEDIFFSDIKLSIDGIKGTLNLPKEKIIVDSSLIGEFNALNIMAAVGGAIGMGLSKDAMEKGIKRLKGVPGRLERIDNHLGAYIFVDYAHTSDSLLKVTTTLKRLINGRLITLFGCGGDRDRKKRPIMGKIAVKNSNLTIITSDNPRNEDPKKIISEIEEGIKEEDVEKVDAKEFISTTNNGYLTEVDRRKAIEIALKSVRPSDCLLIAGKGHENYQIIGNKRIPFDDRKVVKEILEEMR
ncbi:MAG: UDP-N-acetylmuramoyl-L-alanyl-D-glutamate--2,6-diaminopimelate ligase [Spirochaetes bacterium]|nr:MAG: UDP-N-acetylmuramoyl-L-alanyl-D-glutamate--2,6-diaminopimelate ligase [Spirochaetota bacterium]